MENAVKRFRPERQLQSSSSSRDLMIRTQGNPAHQQTGDTESCTNWSLRAPSSLIICLSIHNFSSHKKEKVSVYSSMVKCERVINGGGSLLQDPPEQHTWVLTVTPSARVTKNASELAVDDFIGVCLIRRDSTPGKAQVKFKFSIRSGVSDDSALIYEQPYNVYGFSPNGGSFPIHNFIPHDDLARHCRHHGLEFGPSSSLVIRVQLHYIDYHIAPAGSAYRASRTLFTTTATAPAPFTITGPKSSSSGEKLGSREKREEMGEKVAARKESVSVPNSPNGNRDDGLGGLNRRSSGGASLSQPEKIMKKRKDESGTTGGKVKRAATESSGSVEGVPAKKILTSIPPINGFSCNPAELSPHPTTSPAGGLQADFSRLYNNPLSSDFTLISSLDQRGPFFVHRAILQIRSSHFRQLITAEPQLTFHEIPDFSSSILDALLQFIYTGHATLPDDAEITALMEAGEVYGVPGLEGVCRSRLMTATITMETVMMILVAADELGREDVYERAVGFLRENRRGLSSQTVAQLHGYKADLMAQVWSAGAG